MSYKESFWDGCYDQGWQGLIHPAAFGHPAKYSRGLITRIIRHALDSGYIQPGAVVVDPFGGQAGGGLPCMENGLHYVGVELEPKFVEVGQGSDCAGISKENWIRFYGRWDKGSFPIPEPETLKAAAVFNPSNPFEAPSIKYRPHFCPDCITEARRIIGEIEDKPRSQAQVHRRKRIAFLAKKLGRPLKLYPASPLPGTQTETQRAFAMADSGGSYRRSSGQIPSTGAHRFNGNIERWEKIFPHLPGSATLLQGDSRFLAEVIAEAGLVVGSPPYSDALGERGGRQRAIMRNDPTKKGFNDHCRDGIGYGSTPGQIATLPPGSVDAVIASPSWAGNTGGRGEASRNGIDAALFDRHQGGMKKGTGDDPANLDHLPAGDPPVMVVASPPYAESLKSETEDQTRRKQERIAKSKSFYDGRNLEVPSAGKAALGGGYGITDGQLAAMVCGSPPFENTEPYQDKNFRLNDGRKALPQGQNGYGSTPNQLGNSTDETFWQASHTIMRQVNQILPIGGFGIWVTKGFIKNGKLVDFPAQWQALCESCGFETVEVIRAWLVKRNGAQAGFDGKMVSKDVARKSFFRRLSEAAKKAATHWETLSNPDRAGLIMAAYNDLFQNYLHRLKEAPGHTLPAMTDGRVLKAARSLGWVRDGKIDYEIETAIDYEMVLVTRKRAALTTGE